MKQKIGTYKNIHTGELGNNRSNKQVLSELFNIKPIKTDAQDLLDSCDIKIKTPKFKKRTYKKRAIFYMTDYSDCCNETMPNYPDNDFCSKCGEHTVAIEDQDE